MAVETTSSAPSGTLAASWPMAGSIPAARRRAVYEDSERSEPVTAAPSWAQTSASPLMPAPPMPTKCRRRSEMGGGGIGVRLRPPAAQLLALRRVFAIIFSVLPRTLLLALVMLVALPGAAQAAVSDRRRAAGRSGLLPPTATSDPSISGSAPWPAERSRRTLGTWSPPDHVDLDHIWLRCSAAGTGCAQVAGATTDVQP